MNEEKKPYQKEYDEFLMNYSAGTTTGEHIGEVIAKMAQYFAEANIKYGNALIAYNAIAKQVEERIDDNGKPISSTKAKVIAVATPESETLIMAKVDLENIEQKINALKSFQKGILNEYSHVGNI